MIEVVIKDRSSSDILEIVAELKKRGLKLNIDFDFEYSPGKYDYDKLEHISRQAKFKFYKEKEATYFALRYA